jgi:methionine biosynthesis protein MetW
MSLALAARKVIMRADVSIIKDWIEPQSQVLDLGCGDGSFLTLLKQEKNIFDCGLDLDADNITKCLLAGINVIEQDLDKGLANFLDNSFDTVLLTQTLQAVQKPDVLVDEMLRIGKKCIISFPNFAYWRYRFYLIGKGRMPVSPYIPYEWYNTPNIHFCTIKDFDALCKEKNIKVLNRTVVDDNHKNSILMNINPNFFGINAIYQISK